MILISITTGKCKSVLIAILIAIGSLVCVEFVSRIALSLKELSAIYMIYGFQNIIPQMNLEKVISKNGKVTYYRGVPDSNKHNPINKLGCRGPEIQEKRHGSIRIICIGGSTTYGDALSYHETYPFLLQQRLDKLFGINFFEVINAGQPGMTLIQIIAFLSDQVLDWQPDIVLFMNINNNLKAPGFWFVDVKQADNTTIQPQHKFGIGISKLIRLKHLLISKSAFVYIIYKATTDWMGQYLVNFDYEAFAKRLMAEDNIWENEFSSNLEGLMQICFKGNPDVKIILLEEAVNAIDYKVMDAPFTKAKTIMRQIAQKHHNVFSLDIQTPIIKAAIEGVSVWQSPSYDPLHLSSEGNTVLVNIIVEFLLANKEVLLANEVPLQVDN